MAYYCELARKFLIESKPSAAKILLTDILSNNLKDSDKKRLLEKE